MVKPKIIIYGDPRRRFAAEAMEAFVGWARKKCQILANCFECDLETKSLMEADFAVVFGGDGTILSAARQLCGASVPVIGVNVGKLGFLAEFGAEELKDVFDRITGDEKLIEKRMILECRIEREGRQVFFSTAVNDVVVAAGEPFRMIELKMRVDSEPLASCAGDGVIITTPTGSTAYNMSAGGPIISAGLSAMAITPVCPHSLSFRPIVISDTSEVEICPVRVNDGTMLTLDGQVSKGLSTECVVKVKRHKGAFLLVNNPRRTQWDTLASKLNWGGKPRYINEEEESGVNNTRASQ